MQRREDWDKFVKTMERYITGIQYKGKALKYLNSYNCKEGIMIITIIVSQLTHFFFTSIPHPLQSHAPVYNH